MDRNGVIMSSQLKREIGKVDGVGLNGHKELIGGRLRGGISSSASSATTQKAICFLNAASPHAGEFTATTDETKCSIIEFESAADSRVMLASEFAVEVPETIPEISIVLPRSLGFKCNVQVPQNTSKIKYSMSADARYPKSGEVSVPFANADFSVILKGFTDFSENSITIESSDGEECFYFVSDRSRDRTVIDYCYVSDTGQNTTVLVLSLKGSWAIVEHDSGKGHRRGRRKATKTYVLSKAHEKIESGISLVGGGDFRYETRGLHAVTVDSSNTAYRGIFGENYREVMAVNDTTLTMTGIDAANYRVLSKTVFGGGPPLDEYDQVEWLGFGSLNLDGDLMFKRRPGLALGYVSERYLDPTIVRISDQEVKSDGRLAVLVGNVLMTPEGLITSE